MRAVTTKDFGQAPTLDNVPTPTPGKGEVRIKIHASSLNGFDGMIAAGYTKGMMEHRFPVVLGRDFAGVIDAVGPEATGFKVGDEVFGVVAKPFLGEGAFAEYLTVPVNMGLAKRPSGLPVAEAAALGLAGVTAQLTVDALAPNKGDTVLVVGATGGVGAIAVQLAVAKGARVIATASAGAETDFVRSLGASEVVDPKALEAGVRKVAPQGVQAAAHFAGDGLAVASLVAEGGRFASTLGVGQDKVQGQKITATAIMAMPKTEILERLASAAASGSVRVKISKTYALDEVPQALADFRKGTLGKLSIAVAK
jgi:NADPH:quinone reductase-like Zn-dependent oxidoreductase